MKSLIKFLYPVFAFATAMVGYHIHHNVIYTIVDFCLWPFALGYWAITHNINLTIIKETFQFLLS